MPADILGQGMHDDVCAKLERPAQERCRHRVVDDQRNAMAVGDLTPFRDIDDIAGRVADRLTEQRTGIVVDQ